LHIVISNGVNFFMGLSPNWVADWVGDWVGPNQCLRQMEPVLNYYWTLAATLWP